MIHSNIIEAETAKAYLNDVNGGYDEWCSTLTPFEY